MIAFFAFAVCFIVIVTVISVMVLATDRTMADARYAAELERRAAERRVRQVTRTAMLAMLAAAREQQR